MEGGGGRGRLDWPQQSPGIPRRRVWEGDLAGWLRGGLTQHAQGLPGKLQPSPPAFVAAAAASGPDPQSKLGSKDENRERFLC